MAKFTKTICTRLQPKRRRQLKEWAKQERREDSTLIRMALELCLDVRGGFANFAEFERAVRNLRPIRS